MNDVDTLCLAAPPPTHTHIHPTQVRYRASWGWPNYLDAQAVGWDEALFSRWLIDGQLHISTRVRVLG